MSLESRLESRLKKLEERFRDLKDSNAENISSIEDLYDTINNFKSGSNASDDSNEDYSPSIQSSSYVSFPESSNDIYHNKIGTIRNILEDYKPKCATDTNDYKDLEQFIEYVSTIYAIDKQAGHPAGHSPGHSPGHPPGHPSSSTLDNQDQIKTSLNYFITLNPENRKTILELIHNHKNQKHQTKPELFTILESPLATYHKHFVISKLKMLEQMDTTDAEYYKLKQWLDNLLDIPFGIYKEPDFIKTLNPAEVIKQSRTLLDGAIYGQQNTKNHILEIVARMITNPSARGTVFAVEGGAGVGKTSLIKRGLAPIFGVPFQFISLGGARDMAYLAGENYTYIGSKPGIIVQALRQSKCMNPIFYFDELDKVSDTPYGQEIINLLIHITDPAQNEHFQDMYLDGIPIDLSRALFIFSFNDRNLINPILLDRMEIIKFDKYTYQDKAVITEKYLLPEITSEYFGCGSSSVKVILGNKKQVLKTLILIPHNQHPTSNINLRKFGKGIIKGIIKNTKNRTRGIRCIKRKLEKAIARKNLEELIKPIHKQTRTIVIKSSDFE